MDKDHVSAFASGEPNTAYPQYFTGQSYLKMLTKGKIPVANVTFEPGCRNHWHGAAPDSWFSHIAIEVPAEGSSNEWCEEVSDEEYKKAVK